MKSLESLLITAGGLHFAILLASALTPRVLRWRANLAALPPFLRRLFWVYGTFIVLVIIGFGTSTLTYASLMAAGAPVARGLCAFIAFFWLARLTVQLYVFDARPYLTTRLLRAGSRALTLAFAYLVGVYGAAALFSAPIMSDRQ